jgi:hypothetical protein
MVQKQDIVRFQDKIAPAPGEEPFSCWSNVIDQGIRLTRFELITKQGFIWTSEETICDWMKQVMEV